jgi:hypothetical protein
MRYWLITFGHRALGEKEEAWFYSLIFKGSLLEYITQMQELCKYDGELEGNWWIVNIYELTKEEYHQLDKVNFGDFDFKEQSQDEGGE